MAMVSMDVLGPPGHITISWDPEKEDERKKAKKEFAELKACGYAFFTIPGDDQVKTFKALEGQLRAEKPAAAKPRRAVAVAPMRGG